MGVKVYRLICDRGKTKNRYWQFKIKAGDGVDRTYIAMSTLQIWNYWMEKVKLVPFWSRNGTSKLILKDDWPLILCMKRSSSVHRLWSNRVLVFFFFFAFWYVEKFKKSFHLSFSSILFVAWTFWLGFFYFTWRVYWLSVHPLLAVVFCKHSVFSSPWSRNHVTSVVSPGRRDLSPEAEDCIKDVRFTSALHAIGQPVTAIGERVHELLTVSSSRQVVPFAMFSQSWTTWQVYFHERGRTEGDYVSVKVVAGVVGKSFTSKVWVSGLPCLALGTWKGVSLFPLLSFSLLNQVSDISWEGRKSF